MDNSSFSFRLKMINGQKFLTYQEYSSGDRKIKPFVLNFRSRDPETPQCNIAYDIKLGDRGFSSRISDYCTELELIRHSIEHYIYTGETVITFDCDCSPTEIRLRRQRIYDETTNPKGYRDIVWVAITPDEFFKFGVPFYGFCEERQVIREIYESLLNVGMTGYRYDKDFEAWDFPKMIFYNKIKSPIIEDFIMGKSHKYDEVWKRQVNIDHILHINADILAFLWDEKDVQTGGADIDDIVEFGFDNDENDYKVPVPGIYKWHRAYEDATDFADCRVDEKFDLEEWNRQGLELAKVMRRGLPSNIDLWYCYPFEDEKNRGNRPVLIYGE